MASSSSGFSGGTSGSSAHKQRRPIGEPFRPIAASLRLPHAHVASIDDSHDRCAALGLSRFESPDLSPVARSDFAILRERNTRLYAHAAPIMEMLFEQIETTQSMVVLTDATGTILHSVGDDDFLNRASKVALQPGVNWSESTKGTNAIGTALVSEVPTLVHADEHFMHANHFLTCSSAPILDPRGNVLGVLDCSGDHRSYHQHTMALVKMSARMIENHWLQDDYRNVMRLHFHERVEFIGTLKEGILAVTPDGRIVGANRSALDQLVMNGASLRKQSVESLLGLSVGQLVEHFRSPLAVPFASRLQDGRVLHLLARFDWPVWHTIAEAASLPTRVGSNADTAAAGLDSQGQPLASTDLPSTKSSVGAAASAMVRGGEAPMSAEAALQAASPSMLPRRKALAADLLNDLVAGDAQVADAMDKARRVVDRGLPLLISGERGTGKATFARVLHHMSLRRDLPFVAVACATLQPESIELELFGPTGKLMQARTGTLFLDEVGTLTPGAQLRLMRVLQDKQLVPIGTQTAVHIELALIGSSSVALRELVASHRFRDDLYYRLNGLPLKLPTLRERSDLMELAERLLRRELMIDESNTALDSPQFDDAVKALFKQATWPGNVRQLKAVLRAACALASGEPVIRREHLPYDFIEEVEAQRLAPSVDTHGHATAITASAEAQGPVAPLDDIEIDAIRRAVEACGGNISEASKKLGISRNTIYRKLRWRMG